MARQSQLTLRPGATQRLKSGTGSKEPPALVEKTMKARLNSDQFIDMSSVQVVGTYVMDMIAHNRDNQQDIF